MKKHRRTYEELNLDKKIQYLIWTLAIPMVFCILLPVVSMFISIGNYSTITHNMNLSSDFSLNFKENMDLKMYHYCVGSAEQKTLPMKDVNRAIRLAEELEQTTVRKESKRAIELVLLDCKNLKKKMRAIEATKGYDSRQTQLTNNIYVLTELAQKAMGDYIYYEAGYLKQVEDDMFVRILTVGVLLGIIVVLVVAFVLKKSFRLAKEITDPIASLSENVRKVGYGDFRIQSVETNVIEVKNLNQGVQKMARRIETLLQNVQEEERKQHMIQLELLQAQVSPHFLYNTLDTIVWMIECDKSDEATEMVVALSDFFRLVLSKGKEFISIRMEEQHIRSYLQIQEKRYHDIMEYHIALSPELYEYQIPKMTLQPIVENALYHGIKCKRSKGIIDISGELTGNLIYLTVSDDGAGMDEENLKNLSHEILKPCKETDRGFGLANVNERIRMYFGEEYGIHIESAPGRGTKITIVIPAILDGSRFENEETLQEKEAAEHECE